VGCGAVATLYYAPALRELAKAGLLRVSALVDPESANAERLREHFPMARIHDDVAELAEDTVDLAIVASPPEVHAAQAIHLLRNGIPVLCEKPMAASAAEAQAMVEAAAAARRVLAIGLVRRFLPACQTIRALLSRQVLGEVQSFQYLEGGKFRWPTQSPTYFQRGGGVGGVLADIGSHVLDLVVWWMGEPTNVRYEDDDMGGVNLNCVMELEFPPGFAGIVRLSRDCELRSGFFIRGTKGWLRWSIDAPDELQMEFDGAPAPIYGRLHERAAAPELGIPAPRVRNFEQSLIAELRNVVAAVRGEGEPFVTGRDALAGIRLVERCHLERRLMPMGWLSAREEARAERLAHEARTC
jgi:predicted dehydrogenase